MARGPPDLRPLAELAYRDRHGGCWREGEGGPGAGASTSAERGDAAWRASYSKARALTRVTTAENEEELMGFAQHATASHVETLVRTWRRVDRMEEQHEERERHRSRFFTVRPDVDGMSSSGDGSIPRWARC